MSSVSFKMKDKYCRCKLGLSQYHLTFDTGSMLHPLILVNTDIIVSSFVVWWFGIDISICWYSSLKYWYRIGSKNVVPLFVDTIFNHLKDHLHGFSPVLFLFSIKAKYRRCRLGVILYFHSLEYRLIPISI